MLNDGFHTYYLVLFYCSRQFRPQLIPLVCFGVCAECIPEENLFFIVSPKDVVVSRLRDMDDHISWLMEHERYEVSC